MCNEKKQWAAIAKCWYVWILRFLWFDFSYSGTRLETKFYSSPAGCALISGKWKTKNSTEEKCGYLSSTACPILSPPFNALFTSFTCLFPEAAIFIHTLVPLWLEAGWAARFLRMMCVWGFVCTCICLRTIVHAPALPLFQSILFKDQTRGWWLIFLSPAFFHLLGKRGRGGEKKRRGLPSTHTTGITSTSPPRAPNPPPLYPSEVYPHLWGVHPEKASSPRSS